MAQSYSGFICFLAWTSNIFARPPSKRAVALAFINAFSQLGNFAGSWVSCVICYRTFTAFIINFIRTGIHGKSPGVRPIRPFVRDLHFDERALHCHVLHPQAGALQREQRSTGARVLGRARVQTYTLRSINIMEGITAVYCTIRGRGRSGSVRRKHLSRGREVDVDVKFHRKDALLISTEVSSFKNPIICAFFHQYSHHPFSLSSARNVIPLLLSPSLLLLFPPRCIHPPSTRS
jgi:hypothetical protein